MYVDETRHCRVPIVFDNLIHKGEIVPEVAKTYTLTDDASAGRFVDSRRERICAFTVA